ncbi:hypothetical protein GCM10010412_101070 [Nonomuraea recticatena]|uniref:Uncharacterized protein n=1 Tax=Nonomuraea recticatena TaxID=46178 RepID=A0ABP6FW01_9ACTN
MLAITVEPRCKLKIESRQIATKYRHPVPGKQCETGAVRGSVVRRRLEVFATEMFAPGPLGSAGQRG